MIWKNPFRYTKEEKAVSDAYIRKTRTIRHLLAPHQREFYDLCKIHSEVGLYCSRKTGKTFTDTLIAYEMCIQNDPVICRYVMPTLKTAKEVLLPILEELRIILPTDLFPKITLSDMTAKFKNGSQLKICGANRDAAESARGPKSDFIICDEVAAWDEFAEYMITGILIPQGTTVTNFKIIYSCTPPDSLGGYFIQSIYPKLLSNNCLISIDIDKNPLLTPSMIERIVSFYPKGRDDPNFRREHKLELIPNNTHRLTPEFDEDIHVYEERSKTVSYGNQELPQTYQYFICNDTGTVDNNALLVGYLDHHNQQLVIEDEYVNNNMNLTEIAEKIMSKKEEYEPYFYHIEKGCKIIIDAFSLESKELREIHGIQHIRPIKGKVEDNIAHLRSAFENNKIQISSKCVRLIWELNNCVWKQESSDNNKQIERNSEQKHGDAVMALTYMVRAVNWRFRPGEQECDIRLDMKSYSPKKDSLIEMRKRTPLLWGQLRQRINDA